MLSDSSLLPRSRCGWVKAQKSKARGGGGARRVDGWVDSNGKVEQCCQGGCSALQCGDYSHQSLCQQITDRHSPTWAHTPAAHTGCA